MEAVEFATPTPALHRSVLVVDVADFTDPARTNADQLTIRRGMYGALHRSVGVCGADPGACTIEDRGDGILVLLPSEFPKSHLVTRLPDALVTEVGRHNASAETSASFRLRVALHAGEVHFDDQGVVGDAINLTFRLIEAPALKTALRSGSGLLALVVSEWFYEEVVRHAPDAVPPSFTQIPIAVKKTRTRGWMRVAGSGKAKSDIRPARIDERRGVAVQPDPSVSYMRQLPRDIADFAGRAARCCPRPPGSRSRSALQANASPAGPARRSATWCTSSPTNASS